MRYDDIIKAVAEEENLPIGHVDKIYKSYWKSIRDHISQLPLKENLSDEEFMRIQPNVNIPSIGKLYLTLERYKRLVQMFNIRKEIINATHQKN